jgi:TMEM175 potassium channel family protein
VKHIELLAFAPGSASFALPIIGDGFRAPRNRGPQAVFVGTFFSLCVYDTCIFGSAMDKNRLEAFSDGVIAVIITIMVLELKVPEGHDLQALWPTLPGFLSYVLSYIYVGIYWGNHHHLFKATNHVNGVILWANLHLLFWLSLVPLSTAWSGHNHFTAAPSALYGFVLLMCAVAWAILQRAIVAREGRGSAIGQETARDWKGKLSLVLYAGGILIAFIQPWVSNALYALVAAMWLIPDRRYARASVAKRESRQ